MSNVLNADDLMSLEQYARTRADFRAQVLRHKQARTLQIGPNATWIFEDRLTIQYQVQEMLRIERIFEPAGIQDELDAYNPLIPDGGNWKATFLIEFTDVEERRAALMRIRRIESCCWVQVGDLPRIYAIANEDMERTDEEKTAAVHFLRFELTPTVCATAKAGQAIRMGIDHPQYQHSVSPVPEALRAALIGDLV
jgi:hypothetical protein